MALDYINILVIAYYISLVIELIFLAVPSEVSNRNLATSNPNQKNTLLIIFSTIGIIGFILPLIFAFIDYSVTKELCIVSLSILLIIAGRIITFLGTIKIRSHLLSKSDGILSSGIFSISRNPIALGLNISLVGFNVLFLLAPLAIVSLIFIASMHLKILKEEKHLLLTYNNEFKSYQEKTRRYL